MARAVWKGSIAFGLVNIPVELYVAVRDHRPRFRLLHAKDEAPVRYERMCQTEGKPVVWEDLVKGYEYAKGQFVVLTPRTSTARTYVASSMRGSRAARRSSSLGNTGQRRRKLLI